jgi:hypothetical protein
MLALNCSLFNSEETVINVLKTLASIISMYNLHIILFIEEYTEIFYMIREGDIPSVQSEMNFR